MRVDILDPIHDTELLERLANELWSIVRDDGMWYFEPTYNAPHQKLHESCCLDLCVGPSFRTRARIEHE